MKKKAYITVKDHSVSGEKFDLLYNKEFDLLETYPQPSIGQLPRYYKSQDYISHTDSQRNLFEKAYHLVRNISLKRKLKFINSFSSKEKRLLDVGCGTGDFLKKAQQKKLGPLIKLISDQLLKFHILKKLLNPINPIPRLRVVLTTTLSQ